MWPWCGGLGATADSPLCAPQDKRYYAIKEGDGPVDRSQWNDVKYTLGLDFPNLPYIIHGDVKITESNACLIYVANLAGVAGNTAAERAHVRVSCERFQNRRTHTQGGGLHGRWQVEMMLCKVMDLRNAVVRVGYSPKAEFASRLAAFKEGLPRHLDGMSAFLGDKQWLVSCGLTAPDFHLYEMLRQVSAMVPGCLDEYPTLQAYKRRFEALPAIKRYQTSGSFLDRPFNQPYASFH